MQAIRASKSPSGSVTVALKSVSIPKPSPHQVLVKIKASGVQPSDILNSKGNFPHTTFPRILGRDFSGIVVEGPPNLLNKEVFGTSGHEFSYTEDGAHAEYAALPVDGVCIKPPALSWEQAAVIGVPASAALLILDRSKIKAGESIVVLGASGAVGSWIVWFAKRMLCKVITVGRHGTDIISTEDPKLEKVAALTSGKGASIVADTVGDSALTQASINILGLGGRLVTITAPRSGSTDLTLDVHAFYRKELSLLGCNTVEYSQAHMAKLLREKLLPLLEQHRNDDVPIPKSTPIRLDQAEDAYSGRIRKAVIVFND